MILLLYSLILSLTVVNAIVCYKLSGRKKWLSVFCACNALYQVLIIIDALSLRLTPSLYFIFLTLLFVPGPVLLAMTGAGLNKKLVSRRDFFALFIPALIVIVCTPEQAAFADNPSAQYTMFLSLFHFLALISILHTLSYTGLCLQQLIKNKHSWRPTPAIADLSRHSFIALLLLFCLMAIAQVFSAYKHPDGMAMSFGDVSAMLWSITFNLSLVKFTCKRTKSPFHRLIFSKNNSLKNEPINTLSHEDPCFIHRLNSNLEGNFQNPEYSIQKMAADLYLSPRQLQRKMRQNIGVSPSEYLKQYRLEKARKMLLNQSTQIASVAHAVGFSSPAYFGTCFKQKHNQTPFSYQKNYATSQQSSMLRSTAKRLVN